jgi:altronate dehydratase small subunit
MELSLALKVSDRDNVATIFSTVAAHSAVEVRDKKGYSEIITASADIPYGHKIAVADIAVGERIFKYGEEIGAATRDIKKGEYVHVHNLDSMRGRGDLPNNERTGE